jgi:hypothetical protein
MSFAVRPPHRGCAPSSTWCTRNSIGETHPRRPNPVRAEALLLRTSVYAGVGCDLRSKVDVFQYGWKPCCSVEQGWNTRSVPFALLVLDHNGARLFAHLGNLSAFRLLATRKLGRYRRYVYCAWSVPGTGRPRRAGSSRAPPDVDLWSLSGPAGGPTNGCLAAGRAGRTRYLLGADDRGGSVWLLNLTCRLEKLGVGLPFVDGRTVAISLPSNPAPLGTGPPAPRVTAAPPAR